MKRIHTLLLLVCFSAASLVTIAQDVLRRPAGPTPLSILRQRGYPISPQRLLLETVLQTQSVYPYPEEHVAINFLLKNSSGNYFVAEGVHGSYGDSTYIYYTLPPSINDPLRLFSDSVNWGDTERLPDPISGRERFSIVYGGKQLVINRVPWASMKPAHYDTMPLFTGGLGLRATSYRLGFYCAMLPQHAQSGIIVDQYLGTRTPFSVRDTFDHDFTVNPSDAPGTLSKRTDRFLVLIIRPPHPLPQVGPTPPPPSNSFTAYPSPVSQNGTISLKFQRRYERAEVVITSLITQRQYLRKPIEGLVVQVQLPPGMKTGPYVVTVVTPSAIMTQKISVQ